MTEESKTEEQTQPIRITSEESTNKQTVLSDEIEEVRVKSEGTIPEWLVNFASQPSEAAPLEAEIVKAEILATEAEKLQEAPEAAVTDAPGVTEWKEVQPEEVAEVVKPSVVDPAYQTVTQVEYIPQVPEETRAEVLLRQGLYPEAAEHIRTQARTPETIEQAARQLRSHLVLRSETAPLWSLYEELEQRAKELKTAETTK